MLHETNNANNSAAEEARNFGGLGRPNAVIPSPNEHLYSSLYGREMEMMRKMFKSGDKLDEPTSQQLNTNHKGGYPSGPLVSSGYPPHMFAGTNAAKYFDGISPRPGAVYDQLGDIKVDVKQPASAASPVHYPSGHPFAIGAGGRPPPSSLSAAVADSQLFEHIVHSNNNSSGTSIINANAKHQGLLKPLFDEKHFNINFNNNNSNSNNNNNLNNNNLNTESSLNKSYPGFDAQSQPNEPPTTNHSLLLSESLFVNHQHHHPNQHNNFNVNNFNHCGSDKDNLPLSHQRPFVKSPNSNDFLGARSAHDFDMDNNPVDVAAKGRSSPSAVSPTTSTITSNSATKLLSSKSSNLCNLATKLLTNKHEQREFVSSKSHVINNNNHSNDDDDDEDDEFTNL